MSERRGNSNAPESKREAPKYLVAYSAMMTILLAFFIMLNSLATVQEGGKGKRPQQAERDDDERVLERAPQRRPKEMVVGKGFSESQLGEVFVIKTLLFIPDKLPEFFDINSTCSDISCN